MKHYNISINNNYLSNNIANIDISNINDLINDSINTIFLYCLAALTETEAKNTINILLDKLGLNGTLNVIILDTYEYLEDVLQGKISSQDCLNTLHQTKNLMSLDNIISILDTKKYQINQIITENYKTTISIKKVLL